MATSTYAVRQEQLPLEAVAREFIGDLMGALLQVSSEIGHFLREP
jgi:hypothetical protein